MLSPHDKRLLNLASRVVFLPISSMTRKICTSPRTIMFKMVMPIVSIACLLSRESLVRFLELVEHHPHQCVLD